MDQFNLEQSLGFLLHRTATRLKNELTRQFDCHQFNVTPDQWAVLVSLQGNEGQTQSEIADKLDKDKTNITRILDLLEKKNYVIRRYSARDRRSHHIYLTAASRRMIPQLQAIVKQTNQKSLQGISSREQEILYKCIHIIFDNIK